MNNMSKGDKSFIAVMAMIFVIAMIIWFWLVNRPPEQAPEVSVHWVTTTEFCNGWEDGYKAGWCYQDPSCVDPVIPVCPIPIAGEREYEHGYTRGIVKGKEDRDE